MTQRIRFSPGPVVAAPFQLTLGGGVELVQPAAHRIAAAETYMGLVEVGVGLIPGGMKPTHDSKCYGGRHW